VSLLFVGKQVRSWTFDQQRYLNISPVAIQLAITYLVGWFANSCGWYVACKPQWVGNSTCTAKLLLTAQLHFQDSRSPLHSHSDNLPLPLCSRSTWFYGTCSPLFCWLDF